MCKNAKHSALSGFLPYATERMAGKVLSLH